MPTSGLNIRPLESSHYFGGTFMSEGNIIRSSHHSVTIEKGSKNAKARSAHLEEGFDIPLDSSSTPTEGQEIFNQIRLEEDQGVDTQNSSTAQETPHLSMSEKLANLTDEMSQVSQSLDELQVVTTPNSGGDTGSDLYPNVKPNLQNVNASQAIQGQATTLAPSGGVADNLQDVPATQSVTDTHAALPVETPPARPKLRGAAAMDALKEAKARLAQAGLLKPNVQELAGENLDNSSAVLPPANGSGVNLQNAPEVARPGSNHAPVPSDQTAPNRQPLSADDSKGRHKQGLVGSKSQAENLATLPGTDQQNPAKTGLPLQTPVGPNIQGVDDASINGQGAQFEAAQADKDNRALLENDKARDNRRGVPNDSAQSNNHAALGQEGLSDNKAKIPESALQKTQVEIASVGGLKPNRQGLGSDALSDNQQGAPQSAQNASAAKLPKDGPHTDNNAQVPESALKDNRQPLGSEKAYKQLGPSLGAVVSSNNQALNTDDTTHNALPIEEDGLAPNLQGVPKAGLSDNHQGVQDDDLSDNVAEIPQNSVKDNLAEIPVGAQRGNKADVAVDQSRSNDAGVAKEGSQDHFEPIPEEPNGRGTKPPSPGSGLGPTLPERAGRGTTGSIHQTGPVVGLEQQDQQDQQEDPILALLRAPVRKKEAGKLQSKPSKHASKGIPKPSASPTSKQASPAQEVPKASDTWAEAFRGRVAAIHDQVESLNHKLDDLKK
jgi:hypothetical protein